MGDKYSLARFLGVPDIVLIIVLFILQMAPAETHFAARAPTCISSIARFLPDDPAGFAAARPRTRTRFGECDSPAAIGA